MQSTWKLLPVVLLSLVLISGCLTDDESDPAPGSELHGTWQLVELNVNGMIYGGSLIPEWIMTFNDDGTGNADIDNYMIPYPSSGPFNWSVNGNILKISNENNETIEMEYSVTGNCCITTLLYDYNSDGNEDTIILTFEKQQV
ncbi:lipocalin family protein [bacterium]|nr:lipocalin family protein [bacterium]